MDPRGEVALRDATAGDIPALAELHVRAFRQTHGGGPNARTREEQWRAKFASGELLFCLLLEAEGAPVGFATGERHHAEPREYRGELNKIYLLREWQGRGLGRRLLVSSAQRFMAAGIDSMLLFGDANSRSNGFYERMGGERLHAPDGAFHGGYGWPDLTRLADRAGSVAAIATDPAAAPQEKIAIQLLRFLAGFVGVLVMTGSMVAVLFMLLNEAPFKALAFMGLGFAALPLLRVARVGRPSRFFAGRRSAFLRRPWESP